jgi:hypothetical protein
MITAIPTPPQLHTTSGESSRMGEASMRIVKSRRAVFGSLCVLGLAAGTALGLAGGTALATPGTGIQQMPLATGTLTGSINSTVKVTGGRVGLKTKGNLDVFVVQITIPPGGNSGWHSHAGPVFMVVKQGALTTIEAKGCKEQTLQAGQAIYDTKFAGNGIDVNRGTEPVVVVATFVQPHGASPRVDQPAAAACPSS